MICKDPTQLFQGAQEGLGYTWRDEIVQEPTNQNSTNIMKGKRLNRITAISNWKLFFLNRYWKIMLCADGNDSL